MYKKILVPMALDHDISPQTLEIAQALTAGDGEIVGLHVYEEPQGSARAYVDEQTVKNGVKRARATLQDKLSGMPDIKGELIIGHTYRTIIDYAGLHGIDCIVIGSHKPGLSDYFLGSTAARVVRHALCAVHVYRST